MNRVERIVKEFFRSFYRHLFTNLILMLLFCGCFYLLTVMVTYYADVEGQRDNALIYSDEGRKWYRAMLDTEDTDVMLLKVQLSEMTDGISRAEGYYNDLKEVEGIDSFFYNLWQPIVIPLKVLDEKIGENNYGDFLNVTYTPEGEPLEQTEFLEKDGYASVRSLQVHSVQLDADGFRQCNLQLDSGEGLTEENTTIRNEEDTVPIVLGYEYKKYFALGDEFKLSLFEGFFPCKVTGFLKKESYLPALEPNASELNHNGEELHLLDYDIVFPEPLHLQYTAKSAEERRKYVSLYINALSSMKISMNHEQDFNETILRINKIAEKYQMPAMVLEGTGFGMEVLRSESEEAIHLLFVLSAVMIMFTLFCFVSSGINKIQSNLQTYAVYIMNGAGKLDLILPCLVEMVFILLPAFLVQWYMFRTKLAGTMVYLEIPLIFSAGVFLMMSLIIIRKLNGINIEVLMRRRG